MPYASANHRQKLANNGTNKTFVHSCTTSHQSLNLQIQLRQRKGWANPATRTRLVSLRHMYEHQQQAD